MYMNLSSTLEKIMQENLWSDPSHIEWGVYICPQCKIPQPLINFAKNKSKPSGRDYCCKDCTHKRQTEWYEKNKDYSIAKVADWKKANRDIVNEQQRKHRADNLEEFRARDRKWRSEHKEQDRERKRENMRNRPWEKKAADRCNKRAREKGLPHGMKPADIYDPNTGALPIFCPIFPNIRLDYKQGPDRRCWASVDKKVPALGYVSDNVWVASMAANTWKSNGSNSEERARIIEIMSPKPKSKPRKNNPAQKSLFD
jgi:hypothetical protein